MALGIVHINMLVFNDSDFKRTSIPFVTYLDLNPFSQSPF